MFSLSDLGKAMLIMLQQLLCKLGVQKHSCFAQPQSLQFTHVTTRFMCTTRKVYVHLMRKFCNDMKTKVIECFRLITKKHCGKLIAVATLVLPLGLDKFGHVLNADLLKRDYLLLIASSIKFLPQRNF